jgi:O-antigen/teichoic acid export membrane protein
VPESGGTDGRPIDRIRQAMDLARSGQAAMTVGLLANGIASYVFLAASGRALGPSRFAAVSVLWAVLFLVGSGLFQPFEQELGRSIAARRARGDGFGALVRRAAVLAMALFAIVAVGIAIATRPIADALFRGDEGFVVALIVGIGGVGVMLVTRGLLAGSGRYYGYAVLFFADAATKSIPALALAVAGVREPLVFAGVVAVSAYLGALVPLSKGTRLSAPGPEPAWGPLSSSVGFLLLTSLLSQITLNIGTLAVEILATKSEHDRAGVFLSGLVIARVPLFLFQAVQAIVLPRLSRLAASGDLDGFRDNVRKLLAAMVGATALATAVSAAVGPIAVKILFGEDYGLLGSRDMGMLTFASLLMMCALTINQAQIALHHQHQTGWPWGIGALVFVGVCTVSTDDLFLRVEFGMVAGAAATTVLAAALLTRAMTGTVAPGESTPAL